MLLRVLLLYYPDFAMFAIILHCLLIKIRLKQHTSFEIVYVIEFSHTACYSLLSGYFFPSNSF